MTRFRRPSTPREWFCWAHDTLKGYQATHSPRAERCPGGGGLTYRREDALSIVVIFERAVGKEHSDLLERYFLDHLLWENMTGPERTVVRKTSPLFAKALRKGGYLPSRRRAVP